MNSIRRMFSSVAYYLVVQEQEAAVAAGAAAWGVVGTPQPVAAAAWQELGSAAVLLLRRTFRCKGSMSAMLEPDQSWSFGAAMMITFLGRRRGRARLGCKTRGQPSATYIGSATHACAHVSWLCTAMICIRQ